MNTFQMLVLASIGILICKKDLLWVVVMLMCRWAWTPNPPLRARNVSTCRTRRILNTAFGFVVPTLRTASWLTLLILSTASWPIISIVRLVIHILVDWPDQIHTACHRLFGLRGEPRTLTNIVAAKATQVTHEARLRPRARSGVKTSGGFSTRGGGAATARCGATTKDGQRCKRVAQRDTAGLEIPSRCWQHKGKA